MNPTTQATRLEAAFPIFQRVIKRTPHDASLLRQLAMAPTQARRTRARCAALATPRPHRPAHALHRVRPHPVIEEPKRVDLMRLSPMEAVDAVRPVVDQLHDK